MTEFWESAFQDKQTMWGFAPSDSAIEALELFVKHGAKDILVPGFGYGRNAKVFTDRGLKVTGIEISETAIALARQHYGESITIHHGSVGDMPFDKNLYDGVFCYALIHLLDKTERAKLINDCFNQLRQGGQMIFVAISTRTPSFGEGEKLDANYYKTRHGVKLFYYDADAVQQEFGKYGLNESKEITEPAQVVDGKPYQGFWWIVCKK